MCGLLGVSRFGFSAGFCWSSLRVLLNLLDDLPSNDEKEKSTLVDSPAAVAVGELLLNRLKALGGGARLLKVVGEGAGDAGYVIHPLLFPCGIMLCRNVMYLHELKDDVV